MQLPAGMTSSAEDHAQYALKRATLLGLPTELLQHTLSFLEPLDLASVAGTCRTLSIVSYDDRIWQPIVNSNLQAPISTPFLSSFRDLYIAHHPHWFLTKQRLWFGDSDPSGKLILVRYDESRGCIVAYSIVAFAVRGEDPVQWWEADDNVFIHSFNPKISLDLNQPVLKLEVDSPPANNTPNDFPSDRNYAPASIYSKDILMDTFTEAGLHSSFMLCRNLLSQAITESTAVWPPLLFPASSRTRNESHDHYQSSGHRPTRLSEVSQNNFRLRKWAEYGRAPSLISFGEAGTSLNAALGIGMPYFQIGSNRGGISIRMPEDITTYSSLPEACYTPTPRKPWQGIWCGDYSGHGCEFLLITQPDKRDERPLPLKMGWLRPLFPDLSRSDSTGNDLDLEGTSSTAGMWHSEFPTEAQPESVTSATMTTEVPNNTPACKTTPKTSEHADRTSPDVYGGRLEAIKLTGDPNIPRAQYSFIAPDIGDRGLIRVAHEDIFKGARIVQSAGHIAGADFRRDQYTHTQLILISHNRIAQFWQGFGHISYYQRVDLDALMQLQ